MPNLPRKPTAQDYLNALDVALRPTAFSVAAQHSPASLVWCAGAAQGSGGQRVGEGGPWRLPILRLERGGRTLRCAEFKTTFPDDAITGDEEDVVIQNGGKALAGAIRDLMRARGFTVTEPEDDVEHGWFFDVTIKTGRVEAMVVTIGKEASLLVEDKSSLWNKLTGKAAPVFEAFMTQFDEALRADLKLRKIKWETIRT